MRIRFADIVHLYKVDFRCFCLRFGDYGEPAGIGTLVLLFVSLILTVLILRPPKRTSAQFREALRVLAAWGFAASILYIQIFAHALWAASIVFVFFCVLLAVVLVRPVGRSSIRLKRLSLVLAATLAISGLILMYLGLKHPALPIGLFYWGYFLIWCCLPFWAGPRGGKTAVIVGALWLIGLLMAILVILWPVPEIEKEYPKRIPVLTEKDDRLEDKNPAYVPSFTEVREARFDRFCYFNKSAAVIGLDLAEATESEKQVAETIHPTLRQAMQAAEDLECDFLPSVDFIDGFTKYFDDRLLAAVEEHVHDGSSIFPGGRQGFLNALLAEVLNGPEAPGRDTAAAYLSAAIELGGGQPDVPSAIGRITASYVRLFMDDARNSKPVGFYTRSEVLKKVFYRDRFLQKPFSKKFGEEKGVGFYTREGLYPVVRMGEALLRRPDLLGAYTRFRRLAEGACNPEANLNLEDLFPYQHLFSDETALCRALIESDAWQKACERGNVTTNTLGVAFWPFSTSKENRLFARLYGTWELPVTEIMNDLIIAIKEGRVSLEPEEESGWYDYRLYALESLVLPEKADEANKLLLHATYKKRLREAFEAMLTKRRETHVKQLYQVMTCGVHIKPLPAAPELSLEPCATNYVRTARAYRFLACVIRDVLGEDEADGVKVEGFAGGLMEELNQAALLFYGLYLVVCDDIGMVPKLAQNEVESLPALRTEPGPLGPDSLDCLFARLPDLSDAEKGARCRAWRYGIRWLQHLDQAEFLDEDVRVIVPVLSNVWGTEVRYWAVLGTRLLKVKAYYARTPRVGKSKARTDEERAAEDPESLMEEGTPPSGSAWEPKEYVIPVQVFAEVTLGPKPLTREEFRRICDQYETKDQILAALARGPWRKESIIPKLILGAAILLVLALSGGYLLAKRRRSARPGAR
jgi:hypothetical protein